MQRETGTSDAGAPRAAPDPRQGYELLPQPAPSRFTFDRVIRLVLGLGVVAVLAWLVWYFAALVIYLIIGVVAAYLMRPLVDRIQGIGLGRIPAILTAFVLVFGGIGLLLTFLVPFVATQVRDLSQQIAIESKVRITSLLPGNATGRATLDPGDFIVGAEGQAIRDAKQLQDLVRDRQPGDAVRLEVEDADGTRRTVIVTLGDREETVNAQAGAVPAQGQPIEALGLQVRTVLFSDLLNAIEKRLGKVAPVQEGMIIDAVTGIFETLFREDRIAQLMGSVVSFFTNVFYAVIVIPFVAFFMLKDGTRIRHSLLHIVPNRYFEITLALVEKVETNIGRYFQGLLIQCVSIATVATILLTVVGLESALAVGIFAGLANTIPYFGPLMGFLAGTIVGIAQTGDFGLVPGVLLAMGLTQIADNVLFQPLIFSRAAQAHPLVILFVVLIGAQLGGIVGMLVAIPVTTIVRVTVQQVLWSLRNYRILLAG